VQVHPDDETARKQGEPCGKTECWYVVEAETGAQVALGLRPGTRREEFGRSIRQNCAEEFLNWVNVERGDLIYVDAGTVHTLGPGSIILETQQNSDTTYRLYDYGRPRELHLAQGLEAMKESTSARKCAPVQIAEDEQELIATRCFAVRKFTLGEPKRFTVDGGSPAVLVAVDGCGVVEVPGQAPVMFQRGEAIVMPACVRNFKVTPQWAVEFLKSELP
jgi:mannose-6-phosphate isomerase